MLHGGAEGRAMTAIKQVAVITAAHAKNLGRYLDDDRALARESQHVVDEGRWEAEMDATRETYGRNSPARAGAANTVMCHQVIAFNPDECDINGGKMTPARCMEFARQWVEGRYPDQEAVWVLHRERCAADGTRRYAVHVGINRANLETGRRLNEGRSKQAKVERANAMRDMDRKWGLRQMEAGVRNSRVHARQPTRQEREMAARGARSDKQYVREAVRASVTEARRAPEAERKRAFAAALDAKGVSVRAAKGGRDLTFERRKTGRKVNGVKLGRGYSMADIAGALGLRAGLELENVVEESMDS
jgi:hypothetical protein